MIPRIDLHLPILVNQAQIGLLDLKEFVLVQQEVFNLDHLFRCQVIFGQMEHVLQKLLKDMLHLTENDLTPEQVIEVENFLLDQHELFQVQETDLGLIDKYGEMEIDTGDHEPIRQQSRWIPLMLKREIEKQVELFLKLGIIRKSHSPWASPIVPVRKKDGSLRICVDYRALNKITKKNAYPLPRPDELLDQIGQVKPRYITTLDFPMGYHQIPMAQDAIEKTAFISHMGLSGMAFKRKLR